MLPVREMKLVCRVQMVPSVVVIVGRNGNGYLSSNPEQSSQCFSLC